MPHAWKRFGWLGRCNRRLRVGDLAGGAGRAATDADADGDAPDRRRWMTNGGGQGADAMATRWSGAGRGAINSSW